jgi:hypothetical protein
MELYSIYFLLYTTVMVVNEVNKKKASCLSLYASPGVHDVQCELDKGELEHFTCWSQEALTLLLFEKSCSWYWQVLQRERCQGRREAWPLRQQGY